MSDIGKRKTNYQPETKIKYAKMLANGEASFKEVAAELGTGRATVERWHNQYLKYGEDYFFEEHRGKKSGNLYAALHTSKSLTEVERLNLEIAKLKAENMKLKKAMAQKMAQLLKKQIIILMIYIMCVLQSCICQMLTSGQVDEEK